MQASLSSGRWKPGSYTHFYIHEPKRRLISAAPFRDRVVHHALCNVIEPEFERCFLPDSYANRLGKGSHRAIDRAQAFAGVYSHVLRLDIVRHFPSIDHAVLTRLLGQVIHDERTLALAQQIIDGGQGVLDAEYETVYFPGDDLFAACRPRGLPIGNLTSQFWSNCYLHGLDMFVKRTLRCPAYLRYVDDFALFSNNPRELWEWKAAIIDFLTSLRLTVHEAHAQVTPVAEGIPWLGFVVFPTHRRVKGRKVRQAKRRLGERYEAWLAGEISFGEFDASVQGWVNHVRYADSWRLRENLLGEFELSAPRRRERRAARAKNATRRRTRRS